MNLCKDCKYWTRNLEVMTFAGYCHNPETKDIYTGYVDDLRNTNVNFGCILWKSKNDFELPLPLEWHYVDTETAVAKIKAILHNL